MPAQMFSLLAQQAQVEVIKLPAWYDRWYGLLGILAAIVFISIFAGQALAGAARMRDYAWKISLVLFAALSAAAVIWLGEFKGGIDLAGGTILIYELDQEKKEEVLERTGDQRELMRKMIAAISKRIDPAGVKQVTIRQYGSEQVEIIIPKVPPEEVKLIMNKISKAGNLEFRIMADREMDDAKLIQRAEATPGQVIRDKDEMARKSDDRHAFWIDEAKRADEGETEIKRNGRVRAVWEAVPADKVAEVKADPDLVKRPAEDGQLQQLKIIGQVRAQWVQVGEVPSKISGEPPVPRVDTAGGYWPTRLREDGGKDALVIIDDLHVDGSYLTRASPEFRDGQMAVGFNFNASGAKKFGALTSANVRESGRKRRLGIILDEELLSAPNLNSVIRESGQITGDFTQAEVDELVGILNAGSLPAALNREPISTQLVSPTLGEITIEKGRQAIAYSLFAVLIFMPIYYRFTGLVASCALLLNLLLVLGVMVGIGAAFTLPGLAGLVLTVGMAVDANVLIFERIREESDRGAALRMAIRNGFGRATRTIVDANVTTLITALVLYVIGTDQIKGFAVTLILGILMSMFTAIFCARIIFDIAERRRWITRLGMMRIVGKTEIDFLSKRRIAAAFSILVIGLGMFGVYARGRDLFDIDFLGGSRVEVQFTQPTDDGDVRQRLVAYSEQQADEDRLKDLKIVRAGEGATNFVIETTQDHLKKVEGAIKAVFGRELSTNRLSYDVAGIQSIPEDGEPQAERAEEGSPPSGEAPAAAPAGGASPDESSAPPATEDAKQNAPADKTSPATGEGAGREDLPATSLIALADESEAADVAEEAATATDADTSVGVEPSDGEPASADSVESPASEEAPSNPSSPAEEADAPAQGTKGATETQGDTPAPAEPADQPSGEAADQPGEAPATTDVPPPPAEDPAAPTPPRRPRRFAGGTEVDLKFANPINQETLSTLIKDLATELTLGSPDVEVTNPTVLGESAKSVTDWKLRSTLSADATKLLLEKFEAQLQDDPVFSASTNIGGQVAGDTTRKALTALIASLLCIVGYIWIRFQRVTYGLAAVVALLHDVLVTLGVIALSAYVVDIKALSLPLLLEEFKLSLPMLAAFLTIIGYSLNDTIVVFDRIREVRGKSPELTEAIINTSINQTLSRTLLTSLTTFLVVVILYFFGGPGIHGFAFALVVGVVVGTYSSIFVASPVLLWMSRSGAATDAEGMLSRPSRAPVAG
ncbi:MAG: protein translocase subunit SecD [Planctomycetota bacterium]|nr:protein translocase subunit SecD [Planctomycetota bacterium]